MINTKWQGIQIYFNFSNTSDDISKHEGCGSLLPIKAVYPTISVNMMAASWRDEFIFFLLQLCIQEMAAYTLHPP